MLFLDNLCETVSKCKISFPWQFWEVLITINAVNIELWLTYLSKLLSPSLCFWWTNPINQLGQLCWKVIISSFHQSFFLSRRRRKEAELLFVTLICLFRCQLDLQETFQSSSYFVHGVNVCGVSPVKVNFIIGIDKCRVQANPWAWHIFNHGWSNWHKKWRHACQQEKF